MLSRTTLAGAANAIGQLKRREFIALLGGAAVTWPLAASAQQGAMPVIGFLSSRAPGKSAAVVTAFRKGMSETGFIEGQNAIIAFRWAEGHYERLPSLASDLVGVKCRCPFCRWGTPRRRLLRRQQRRPFRLSSPATSDPVRFGLVASLNRPGGNTTGMS